MTASLVRRQSIITDQKYPKDFIVTHYKDARETIAVNFKKVAA